MDSFSNDIYWRLGLPARPLCLQTRCIGLFGSSIRVSWLYGAYGICYCHGSRRWLTGNASRGDCGLALYQPRNMTIQIMRSHEGPWQHTSRMLPSEKVRSRYPGHVKMSKSAYCQYCVEGGVSLQDPPSRPILRLARRCVTRSQLTRTPDLKSI